MIFIRFKTSSPNKEYVEKLIESVDKQIKEGGPIYIDENVEIIVVDDMKAVKVV